jgi:hypothetical protein
MSSLGILSRGKRDLGATVQSTIPGECWEQSGFKGCHAQMYETAQVTCRAQGKENDACIIPLTDQLVKGGCKCTKKTSVVTVARPSGIKTEALAPRQTILGMDMSTALLIGAGAMGLYFLTQEDPKKKG